MIFSKGIDNGIQMVFIIPTTAYYFFHKHKERLCLVNIYSYGIETVQNGRTIMKMKIDEKNVRKAPLF